MKLLIYHQKYWQSLLFNDYTGEMELDVLEDRKFETLS